jgi:nitroimidazol reductase NimA-like FMN-containing flavoprotein (pyridoxamine 5'-phosphate oxidase superfamily)
MSYHSVIGWGETAFLEGEEKVHALDVLTDHYHPEGFAYDRAVIPATTVYKLTVRAMTGKIRPMK